MTPDQTPKPDEPENLSFGALAEDLEGFLPRKKEIEVPDRDIHGEEISLSEQEKLREKKEMEMQINAKVLGASGAKRQPMWVKSCAIAGVSVFLFFFLSRNPGMKGFEPMGSYATMVVGAGSALWGFSGMSSDEEPYQKILNGVCLAVSVIIVIAAWLSRG